MFHMNITVIVSFTLLEGNALEGKCVFLPKTHAFCSYLFDKVNRPKIINLFCKNSFAQCLDRD